ncbi:MoaD/ThiS family protein [Colwellia sp. MEBiC06753]
MITVKFFGQLRELLSCHQRVVELPEKQQVADLLQVLIQDSDKWQDHLQSGKVLVAVNHTMSSMEQQLHYGDEVAFFPPVTGG